MKSDQRLFTCHYVFILYNILQECNTYTAVAGEIKDNICTEYVFKYLFAYATSGNKEKEI